MGLRKFSSGLKRKLRHRFWGGRHELEGTGGDAGGGEVGSTTSLPQPGPHSTVKDKYHRCKSWNEAYADGGQVDSADPTPHSGDPGFVPISEDQHDREPAIKGKETSEGGSYLGSGVEHSGPGQGGNGVGRKKINRVDPLPSTPSMKPESMQTACFSTHYL